MGYPRGLRDAAGWSVSCSSSTSYLGYCSLFGDAFSKCKVSQSFGIVSADASLQPLSIAKQSPCFNGQVPPCSGRCDPSAGVFGLRRSVRGAPFSGSSADLRAGGSLSGSWSLNGRLWTKVCTCIRSEQSSSVPCESSRCCTSGSRASVVSRSVTPVSSVSAVSVGGVGGSRVGFGVGVSRGGVEGGFVCCLCDSDRKMGGGAAPGSTNSWSDTVHACGPSGGLCSKGGVSGPAEDLRPVPEVVAGVNFRPAGGVRRQVAGSLSGKQPGTGTRTSKGSVVTPSLHPEVPDSLSVSPGPGMRIRQSMGWTKVCGTAQSGIWVLKGNARTCMFPANLDHLRVGWRKQGSYKTAWVTPGHDCLCSYKYGHGAAVRPQTNKAIWDGVISLWGRVAPFLSPWCGKKELPTGVNLNHYDGSRSCVRWHSDNEALFGPRDSPKLIVSLSLGNPVEFKVRRVSDSVTSSITLDHGDVLVMDGSAQSEYLHCTMPGLQGPRVNLTYRWVAQHTASCPLAGVVGCLLPSCVQGLAEPGSRLREEGENNRSFPWELAFLLFILMSVLLGSIWMNTRKECRHSGQRFSCSSAHFPSRGRARWVGGRRWPLSRRSQFSRKQTFYFPGFFSG